MYVYSFPTSRPNTHGNKTAKFTFIKTSIFNEGAATENGFGHMGCIQHIKYATECVNDIRKVLVVNSLVMEEGSPRYHSFQRNYNR